jgi:hypothetical protein
MKVLIHVFSIDVRQSQIYNHCTLLYTLCDVRGKCTTHTRGRLDGIGTQSNRRVKTFGFQKQDII